MIIYQSFSLQNSQPSIPNIASLTVFTVRRYLMSKIVEQSFSETGKLPCLAKTKECENKNITVTCNNMRMKILWHFEYGFDFSSCSEFWAAKLKQNSVLNSQEPGPWSLTSLVVWTLGTAGWRYSLLEFIMRSAVELVMAIPSVTCLSSGLE